ncbi:MAG TPA: response regulator [Flavisolibacter sp.]|nr:response regulator [Flavisolibacter sp.]
MLQYKVLIVDDDPDDLEIMNEAFLMQGSTHHLTLSSAQAVFLYLQDVKRDEDLPSLIITDLNMPGISGFELLQALKGMQRYKHIDVFVYSTSNTKSHIDLCLALGAKEYITKPSAITGYQQLAERISSTI